MKKYLITSKDFYKEDLISVLKKQLKKHMPEYVLYRDKSNPDYEVKSADFVKLCQEFDGIKSFIHQKVDLAHKLGASGVHLTSKQFEEIKYAKSLGLEVIISTHTHEEVLDAQNLGADAVTYSPIFYSPQKGEPKGIDDLNELLKKCDIKVFALGGIVDSYQVEKVKETLSYGFASIRYFYR